jgi:hypothetical protein
MCVQSTSPAQQLQNIRAHLNKVSKQRELSNVLFAEVDVSQPGFEVYTCSLATAVSSLGSDDCAAHIAGRVVMFRHFEVKLVLSHIGPGSGTWRDNSTCISLVEGWCGRGGKFTLQHGYSCKHLRNQRCCQSSSMTTSGVMPCRF